ncbi:GFA family protein [Azospirillum ramasamyi]|uniref:GFA family protein n=1 Tax=Azospirillum ramasamyi TaxID=682998 RepID=A0A2U9S1Z3_9PROT|nr:GFA family protein [Azospirillum ramasamyi]AWU93655.1 GFA family protein [Azospirillum ramasamyi]
MAGASNSMTEHGSGENRIWTGGCLCGGVRYAIDVQPEPISFCHCGQCRRQHSHVGAYAGAPRAALRLLNDATLTWYVSSSRARRGFCVCCGAGLFWEALDQDRADGEPRITVTAGSLDDASGLRVERHIFVDHKGPYYDIGDDGVERRTSTGEVVA